MRTVLFGLDGATYTILDHLVAEGVMPHLGRIYERGCRCRLLSTPNPITPQAWTTMATGRSAGHHGIHDFIRPEPGPQGIFWRVNDARDNHCETIWRYASRLGKRVTVLNYFGTAPPEPIQGHSMPGFVSGRHLRRSSYPADLFDRLRALEGFDVGLLGLDLDIERQALQDMEPSDWCRWIRHHLERERVWFRVLQHLMTEEPSDLTAIVLDGVDKIQHLAYRYLDPALAPHHPDPWESEVIALCRTYFRQVDEFLGWTIDRVSPWGRVFVASDHGFTATHEVVYINKWLSDQGLLRWREEVPEDQRNAIFSDRLASLADAIDLENTRAYALLPSANGIYINNVPPEEYEAFRDDLIDRLWRFEGPDGGRIITRILKREEHFPGPFMHRLPDLTLALRDCGFVSVLNSRASVIPRPQPAGTHHPEGVLLGIGPGLLEGAEVGLRNILDVTPLLTHSLGLEIPAAYEGQFPADFYESAYLDSDAPRIRPADGSTAPDLVPASVAAEADMDEMDQAILLDRLQSLGYIE